MAAFKVVLSIAFVALLNLGAKGDALADRQKYGVKDFVVDVADLPVSTPPEGVKVQAANGNTFPAIQGEGLSLIIFTFPPCAMNAMHVHPRGAEMIHIVKGNIEVGFAEENGGRFIVNRLKKGQFTIFPKGLVHFQFNDQCKGAQFVSAQADDDAGTQSFPHALLGFDNDIVKAAFGLNGAEVKMLRDAFSMRGRQAACMRRCGLM